MWEDREWATGGKTGELLIHNAIKQAMPIFRVGI